MKNRVKEFIQERGITAYRFWKETGLSRPTAYRVCSDPDYPIGGDVLEKICDAYKVQPGEVIYWIPSDEAVTND